MGSHHNIAPESWYVASLYLAILKTSLVLIREWNGVSQAESDVAARHPIRSGASAPPQPQQCRRFEIVILPSHREMEMRASDATARSTLRDGVALIYAGALPD